MTQTQRMRHDQERGEETWRRERERGRTKREAKRERKRQDEERGEERENGTGDMGLVLSEERPDR